MAAICIKDLQAGFDLISEQESYLNELTDEEFRINKGGVSTAICTVVATVVVFTTGAAASYAVTRFVKTFF
ncbi:MAG: hypothetical protein KME35_17435 [Aphanocapsa sp. GSE-SYN-MK-11-07L]|jgi:hypothetical protein|nr:hypothetical protein [Aphanocapsa sp. GSE-SYN-MK-11-07L]